MARAEGLAVAFPGDGSGEVARGVVAGPHQTYQGTPASIAHSIVWALLFFFFVVWLLATLRKIDLHPMNYFFRAAALFAFHLLLAYLVDHISVHAAFLAASAVSVFLVVSYLRLVVGMRFAALEAGGAQLVYLVLFSYAFFLQGFTGLAITIGAVVTLFCGDADDGTDPVGGEVRCERRELTSVVSEK
jgi:inner membrane protein involved in colicin E2 resistance